jgi:electron transport complex protein RnfG
MGYQDLVSLLFGVDPTARTITHLNVLGNRETPGLGSKIATDERFIAQFQGLPLDHPIEVVKPGRGEHPWQIDAITGATISSKTVARAINRSVSPSLTQQLQEAARGRTDRNG